MVRNFFKLLLAVCLLSSCNGLIDQFKEQTWQGHLYRSNDQKELSDVLLKFTDDSLYIYSNAVYGAENDTLAIQQVNKKDSSMLLKNKQGETFTIYFQLEVKQDDETLFIYSNDYYISLEKSNSDITQPSTLDFYRNKIVPRETAYYLDGTYVGQLQMENQLQNALFASMGGMRYKFIFMDDFKVKAYSQSAMLELFSGGKNKSKISSYSIKGNKLYIDGNEKVFFEIRKNGSILVMQKDEVNLVLQKIY